MTDEIKSILERYRVLLGVGGDLNYPVNQTITFEISENLGTVKYTFPPSDTECQRLEAMWYCPTIFSMFYIEDFYRILTAVLLERSLVFVTNNLAILSSVILGFKTLLKPFSWCYALIPVLPSPLIGILDTP